MPRQYETAEPAAEPRPGPTRIGFFRGASGLSNSIGGVGPAPVDDVPHDEEVVREPHFRDDVQLRLEPFLHLGGERDAFLCRGVVAVAVDGPVLDEVLEVGVGVAEAFRQRVVGETLVRGRDDLVVAAVSNDLRHGARCGPRCVPGHDVEHFLLGLDVVAAAVELEATRIVEALLGSDSQEPFVGPGVLFIFVVAVVGDDHRDVVFAGEGLDGLQDGLLGVDAVIHDFEVDVFLADAVDQGVQVGARLDGELGSLALAGLRPRHRVFAAAASSPSSRACTAAAVASVGGLPHRGVTGQRSGDRPGEAAGKDDQALAVLFEQGVVDARLVPVRVFGLVVQGQQVLPALFVPGQQRQVLVAFFLRLALAVVGVGGRVVVAVDNLRVPFETGPDGHVDFDTDDRLDAGGPAGFREPPRTGKGAVLSLCHGGLAQCRSSLGDRLDSRKRRPIRYVLCGCGGGQTPWVPLNSVSLEVGRKALIKRGGSGGCLACSMHGRPRRPPSGNAHRVRPGIPG